VWGADAEVDPTIVDVYLRKLRDKIAPASIQNVARRWVSPVLKSERFARGLRVRVAVSVMLITAVLSACSALWASPRFAQARGPLLKRG
jgi:hypothetical protein